MKNKNHPEPNISASRKGGSSTGSQRSPANKISNFVIFQTDTGKVNINVCFQDETLWLTQKKLAELFEKSRPTISGHLKNIFSEGELNEESVCRDFRHTAEDGKTYNTKCYNLKAITAVGYRVNSHRATEFRKLAEYGKQVLEDLSKQLNKKYVKGFSVTNLQDFRRFYTVCSERIGIQHQMCVKSSPVDNIQTIKHPTGVKSASLEKLHLSGGESDKEKIHNPDFNYGEFAIIRSQTG